MFNYLKLRKEKKQIKRIFKEYGYHIETFTLSKEGKVDFALWDNPLEQKKDVTQEGVNFYKQFAPKGSLVIDIGSHMGDTTVPMALAAGKEGLTLAFDPNPHVFKVLMQNAGLNRGKTNIIPLNYAISVEDGEFYYNSSEATHNNGGISEHKKNRHGKYRLIEKVKGINLEKYLQKEHSDFIDKISLIKIDTEGYDLEIIRSIRELILKYRPTIIAECFKKLKQGLRYDLFELFQEIKYDLFQIIDFSTRYEYTKIKNREDMRNWKHFDFCAVPEEKRAELIKNL